MPPEKIGPYRLIKLLGQGGMAEAWAARKTGALGASQLAVVKRILPQHADDRAFLHAFIDEARLAVRLNHPNIVQVLEVGETADEPYLALELVDGADLETVLAQRTDPPRPLATTVAARLAADVLRALAYAHALTDENGQPLDVVHRDVSPPNILFSRAGAAKLADFGIAKAKGRLTKTNLRLLKGKTPYMSPEQTRGEPLDGRSDLFSLGAVLWECLAGARLFESGDDLRNLDWVRSRPVPPPSARRADIEPDLDAVVMRLLERDRTARFASAAEALAALEQTRAHRDSRPDEIAELAASAGESLRRLRPATAELEPDAGPTLAGLARRRRRALAWAALAATILAVASWIGWRRAQAVQMPPAAASADLAGATLVVKPATPGALAQWDGEALGVAPLVRRFAPDGKRHEAALERPGYATWRRQFDFKKPRTIDDREDLARLTGRLVVPADFAGPLTVAGRVLAPGDTLILPAGAYLARTAAGEPLLAAVAPNADSVVSLDRR